MHLLGADGNYLVDDDPYHLHLPPNVPVGVFWSVTIYSPVDGTMINNGQLFPSINSMSKIAKNADGSYELYFDPQLPPGGLEELVHSLCSFLSASSSYAKSLKIARSRRILSWRRSARQSRNSVDHSKPLGLRPLAD